MARVVLVEEYTINISKITMPRKIFLGMVIIAP